MFWITASKSALLTYVCIKLFNVNRIVAKRSVLCCVVPKSLVLPECSQSNEIRYVSLRYG